MKSASSPLSKDDFSQFYSKNYAWLYGWLCKKLKNQAKAEDILQDTFTKILSLQRLAYIEEPKAYLTRTANRLIIDQARKEKIEQIYLEYLHEVQLDHYDYSTEDILIAVDILNTIAHLLNGLEERTRQVLLMHHLDGMTQMEIAQILKVSRKTIQTDLIKAMVYCHKNFKADLLSFD